MKHGIRAAFAVLRYMNLSAARSAPHHFGIVWCITRSSVNDDLFVAVYMNGLDQFVKHTLRYGGYVRDIDDFLLFADGKVTPEGFGSAFTILLNLSRGRQITC